AALRTAAPAPSVPRDAPRRPAGAAYCAVGTRAPAMPSPAGAPGGTSAALDTPSTLIEPAAAGFQPGGAFNTKPSPFAVTGGSDFLLDMPTTKATIATTSAAAQMRPTGSGFGGSGSSSL